MDTLAELAQAGHRIVGVVNDSVGSSKPSAVNKAFPDRLLNVGIAEQDMVGGHLGPGPVDADGGTVAEKVVAHHPTRVTILGVAGVHAHRLGRLSAGSLRDVARVHRGVGG